VGPYSLEQFEKLLSYAAPGERRRESAARIESGRPSRRLGSALATLSESSPSYCEPIADACGHIGRLRSTRGNIDEPYWYDCLGILAFCEDGDERAYEWSNGHPGYTERETRKKLEQRRKLSGATHCNRLGTHDPKICSTCPYAGKITSPIVLGRKRPGRQADVGAGFSPQSGMQSERVGTERGAQTATTPTHEPGATYHRLAVLTPYEYDRVRAQEAENLGIRVATLDSEVDKIRPAGESTPGPGRPLSLPSPEPWTDPVSGVDLLNEIARAIHRYVVLPSEAIIASTLFVAYAHAFEAWSISPRLAITSPEMQCGKTTLLSVLEPLVPRPLKADNVTAAAVFRVVELARPTLMIDEADSFLKDNEELRGVLNSGHRNNGQVIRLVGDHHEARTFSTWCPTVIAAIGRIPSTLEDRSISISMRRALPEEKVCRFDDKERHKLFPLARKARRWASDHMEALRVADPRTSDALHGRAADNWRPLLAVAEVAGSVWPDLARQACERLAWSKSAEQDSVRVQLLADIRALFEDRRVERISSVEIVQALCLLEGRPWQDWGRGKPITPNQLARLLAPFGVRPKTMRIDKDQPLKGYEKLDFDDAFKRYLPRIGPPGEQ
jgi:Protein of unknown function (DUF3631)